MHPLAGRCSFLGIVVAGVQIAVGAALAGTAENFFARLDAVPAAVVGRVTDLQASEDGRLVTFRVAVVDKLKGSVQDPLFVVDELLFRSDVPLLRSGDERVLLVERLPGHSSLRGRLAPERDYFRVAGRRRGVRAAAAAEHVRAYVKAAQRKERERAGARVAAWIGALRSADVGDDAAQALASLSSLETQLDEKRARDLGAVLADRQVPETRRRALVAVAGERRLQGLRGALRGLLDEPAMAPFARRALVALGESFAADVVQKELASDDVRLRVAALHSTVSLPVGERLRLVGNVARTDPDYECRAEATRLLGDAGEAALPQLSELLRDGDGRVAYVAGQALVRVGGEKAVDALSAQFDAGTYDGQVAAVFALREIGSESALRALKRVYEAPPDPRLRNVIEAALGGRGGHH